jgi:hypothetical protein
MGVLPLLGMKLMRCVRQCFLAPCSRRGSRTGAAGPAPIAVAADAEARDEVGGAGCRASEQGEGCGGRREPTEMTGARVGEKLNSTKRFQNSV